MTKEDIRKLILKSSNNKEVLEALWELYEIKVKEEKEPTLRGWVTSPNIVPNIVEC